jgi:hypothetical protein
MDKVALVVREGVVVKGNHAGATGG